MVITRFKQHLGKWPTRREVTAQKIGDPRLGQDTADQRGGRAFPVGAGNGGHGRIIQFPVSEFDFIDNRHAAGAQGIDHRRVVRKTGRGDCQVIISAASEVGGDALVRKQCSGLRA